MSGISRVSEPEVWVWSGDFGLPSIFPDCLRLVTYLKFWGKPFKLVEKYNPLFAPETSLPLLIHGNVQINDVDAIIDYLSKNFPIDSNIVPDEGCEAYAHDKYIRETLYPCLQYAWWVDEKNYEESTRPWFAKQITIPFNFYYPSVFRERAKSQIEIIYGEDIPETELYHKIYKKANSFFKDISARLGRHDYFFGTTPSSVDATLFSYLAPILKFPLINPTITNHLKNHINLVKYVQRITSLYYPELEKRYIDIQEKKKVSQRQSDIQKKDTYKTEHKIFAILIAALAMLGYARSNGLLGKNQADTPEYNFFESDDDYKL
ncbi:metaxin-1 isoform X2 [Arctopsyche grandis]|uniref:metaxin-1 isoform X2 n=1 Tax=Arctopsyche grandis TaxID=121162 RepID=UPI00406D9DE6